MVRDFVGRDVDEDRLTAEVVRRRTEEEADPPRYSVGVRVLATASCSPGWRIAGRETRSGCGGGRVAGWSRGTRWDAFRLRRGWTAQEGQFVVDRDDTAHVVAVAVAEVGVVERRAASCLRGAFRRRVVEPGRVASGVKRRRVKAVAGFGQRCSRTERRLLHLQQQQQQHGPSWSRFLLLMAVLAGAAVDSAVLFRGQS